jgi:nitrogen-specific signal transduction histidine kinase
LNAKNVYVSYTTHEIRSPLTTVVLGLELLIDELINADIQERIKDIIETLKDLRNSSNLSLSIVNDLLAIDKFQAGKMTIDPCPVSVHDFISGCIQPFLIQAKAFEISIDVKTSDSCLEENYAIFIDRVRAEPIMRNFLSNALKFSYKHSTVTVELVVQQNFTIFETDQPEVVARKKALVRGSDGVLRVNVIDHGVGISKANQAKLFELFVQIDAKKLQQGKGSGIGLWLSKEMVEIHGGVIGVESQGEGQGSTFYFELPLFHMISATTSPESVFSDFLAPGTGMGSSIDRKDCFARQKRKIIQRSKSSSEINNLANQGRSQGSTLSSSTISSTHQGVVKSKHEVLEAFSFLDEHIRKNSSSPEPKYRVLVVDDMPLIRKLVRRSIESIVTTTKEAVDGLDAVNIIRQGEIFDVILMDGYMPKVSSTHVSIHLTAS